MDYNAETPDYCYGCKSLATQLAQKDVDIERLQERIKGLEEDNRIMVGDYVIYRDFPNAGWSRVLSIQTDMPSIEPLAHLVDEYGNTGTEPLRRLVKANSPHLTEKPKNRTTEKPNMKNGFNSVQQRLTELRALAEMEDIIICAFPFIEEALKDQVNDKVQVKKLLNRMRKIWS